MIGKPAAVLKRKDDILIDNSIESIEAEKKNCTDVACNPCVECDPCRAHRAHRLRPPPCAELGMDEMREYYAMKAARMQDALADIRRRISDLYMDLRDAICP
ncbi:unnamed protein product, partial [Mesorhabditis spiculigera]